MSMSDMMNDLRLALRAGDLDACVAPHIVGLRVPLPATAHDYDFIYEYAARG